MENVSIMSMVVEVPLGCYSDIINFNEIKIFEYCDKYIQKISKECNYQEVKRFIEVINERQNKEFELVDCPDKLAPGENQVTADLHYKDKNSGEELWIEVKEVIMEDDKKKKGKLILAKDNGQRMRLAREIACMIHFIMKETEVELKKDLNKYYFEISNTQIGGKDIEKNRERILLWLMNMLCREETELENLELDKINNKDIIRIFIYEKTEEMLESFPINEESILVVLRLEDDEMNFGENLPYINFDLLKNKVIKNIKKTLGTKNKFPKAAKNKTLLNILRFPQGRDIFWKVAFSKGKDRVPTYFEKEIKPEFSIIEGIDNLSDVYLLYYMDEYYQFDKSEPDRLKVLKDGILSLNIKGELLPEHELIAIEEE